MNRFRRNGDELPILLFMLIALGALLFAHTLPEPEPCATRYCDLEGERTEEAERYLPTITEVKHRAKRPKGPLCTTYPYSPDKPHFPCELTEDQ